MCCIVVPFCTARGSAAVAALAFVAQSPGHGRADSFGMHEAVLSCITILRKRLCSIADRPRPHLATLQQRTVSPLVVERVVESSPCDFEWSCQHVATPCSTASEAHSDVTATVRKQRMLSRIVWSHDAMHHRHVRNFLWHCLSSSAEPIVDMNHPRGGPLIPHLALLTLPSSVCSTASSGTAATSRSSHQGRVAAAPHTTPRPPPTPD